MTFVSKKLIPFSLPMKSELEIEKTERFAREIRRIAVTLAHRTNTSHTGGALSQADILAVLYDGVLRCSPDRVDDPMRDRFIESKGHNCASLYAALALKGFIDLDDLMENYCRNGSQYFEHVSHKLAGVELSTGSLGHGLPVACGMALGAKRKGRGNRVFCIIGDGELDEGSNWEAIAFAAHHSLDNLCVILDKNGMQALGDTADVLSLDPVADKLRSFKWNTVEIDGNDVRQVISAFDSFEACTGRPTFIVANTVKGKGVSYMEHNLRFHYSAPNEEEYKQAMEELK